MKNNRTKEEFEKALFTLLKKKNYHDITINEICDLTHKTKMTFYHHYKDKDDLLAIASINLINREYGSEYEKLLKRETDIEEIEYQSLVITFDLVARLYDQIQNLIYKGETLPLEIFKRALFENYSVGMNEFINTAGFDIPGDYMSVFCFEGLYGSCLYYAEQLKNNKNKKKVKEDSRKLFRILAKAVVSIATTNQEK